MGEGGRAQVPTNVDGQLHLVLDNMPGALVYTDAQLRLVVCNERFREMYRVPQELLQPGRPYPDLLRHLATSGYYGRGEVEAHVAKRVESLRNPSGVAFEDHTPDGRWYRVLRRRAAGGGAVTVMTDITDQKLAEQELADKQAQLHVALDNMPARSSTPMPICDSSCATIASGRCTSFLRSCCNPAGPIPTCCGIWPKAAITARGDVDALVAKRVESLRNPSGLSFEDHTPDGRWYRVLRRRVAGGGAVTVMTDITVQKQAERDLLDATRRTEEANKLITEKNRALEALYAEIRDKNRKVEEQAAQIAEWNARLEARVTEQVARIGQMSKLTRFLSPKISDLIMSGDADDSLKARRTEITVVFVDLARLHGLHRDRRARGGDERAARVSRRARARDHGARRDDRALRRRRRDDPVQRSGAGRQPRVAGHPHGASHARIDGGACAGLEEARLRARLRRGHRRRLRDDGRDRVRRPTRVQRDRDGRQSRRASLRRSRRQPDSHLAANLLEDRDTDRCGTVGELSLKGFNRPVPAYNVVAIRP
jgi:PAS domain-containing protein